jgi:hypothetical protein
VIAVDGFDLDHFRAEIGQHQPAGRTHDDMDELYDADAFERESIGHMTAFKFADGRQTYRD